VKPEDVVNVTSSGIMKLVYTGDTAPTKNVVSIAKGAQLLIHDSTFSADEDGNLVWNQGHSRSIDAASIAKEAGVDKLILTHISNRYPDPEVLSYEASKIFPNVIAARDLLSIVMNA
jgi:ribonuclease Z